CRTTPALFHPPPSWRSTTRREAARRNLSSKSLREFPRRCRREVRTCSPNRSELLLDQTRAGQLRGKFQRHLLRRSSARTPNKWPAGPSRFFRSGEILRPRIAFDSVRTSAGPSFIYVNLMASAFSPSSKMPRTSREASAVLTPSGVNLPDHSTRERFPSAAGWTRSVDTYPETGNGACTMESP